ncbi:putative ankyrin repeat protein RF_0381 isoform X2 [Saccostrea echinata]|uniref:putative ankyrin repeat protein RF_0381 isoform X2 n=1 Tax=Saccostrea echinata TaxID=191078 RepID=UPI002A80A69D|nr:putative ankyrin repeat protein RF_0381 isoform X2 [Saccostrea echinata]
MFNFRPKSSRGRAKSATANNRGQLRMGKGKPQNGPTKVAFNKDPLAVPRPHVPERQNLISQTDMVINSPPNDQLQRLLKEKPDIHPNTRDFFDLMIERQYSKIKKMLKEGKVDVNSRDTDNHLLPTPLLIATELNDVELVKLLLKAKPKPANVNDENIKGRRPIWWAARWANEEITDLLLNCSKQKCEVNFVDKESGCAPLYRAILSNAVKIVQLLIHAGADINLRILGLGVGAETPLIKAIQKDNKEICELLINSLCKLHAKTTSGLNALHYAVAYRRYDICELLLENGIKINSKSPSGVTAMTVAVEQQIPAMVKLLLEYGYRIDKKYKWKETPLQHAINIHSEECAVTLIHYGCSLVPDAKWRGPSYFFMAVNENQMKVLKFMVALKPTFLNEKWLQRKKWPVSIYRRPDIIEWLEKESQRVQSLKELCRGRIFHYLGKFGIKKIDSLQLPETMKDYLRYKEFIKEKYYVRKKLDLKCCPFECPSYCANKRCLPIEISSSEEDSESSSGEEEPNKGTFCKICMITHPPDMTDNLHHQPIGYNGRK